MAIVSLAEATGAEQLASTAQTLVQALNKPRSVLLQISNNTNTLWNLVANFHTHGEFLESPDSKIPPKAVSLFTSQSTTDSVATGTEGFCNYRSDDGQTEIQVIWDNPFSGNNSCDLGSVHHANRYRFEVSVGHGEQGAKNKYEIWPADIIWDDQQKIDGAGTQFGPSLAVLNNRLYAAWKGIEGDQGIYWSFFDGHNWTPQKKIDGVGTSHGLSLVVMHNRLYGAWPGVGDDHQIYWSSSDGQNWAPQQKIGGAGTSLGLALSAFDPFLYALWKGVDDGDHRIFWSTLNLIQGSPFGSGGNTWAPPKQITDVGTSSSPSLAAINLSRVYAAWKGIDDDQQIYWSSHGGQNWAPQQKIEGAGTSVGPSLAVVGVEPFALWKGVVGDSRILWTRYDGQNWRPQQTIRGIGTAARPALVLHPGDGKLYAAWRGIDDDQQIYWTSGTIPIVSSD